jgi:hypothetical protein
MRMSSEEVPEEFRFDTGLKDNWDGTIVSAAWEQSSFGGWGLKLRSLADDGDEVEHRPYSVGGADKGWVSHDGGEEILNPTLKRFNDQTAMAGFVKAAIEAGALEELAKRSREQYGQRGPMFAKIWHGLRFHWDVVEETGRRQEGGEWKEVKVNVMKPTKYLGTVDPKVSSGSTTSQASTTPASSNGSEISDEDLRKLRLLALDNDTWEDFVDEVLKTDSHGGERLGKLPAVRKLVSKKAWYEELRS